jgi:hypothetical protein
MDINDAKQTNAGKNGQKHRAEGQVLTDISIRKKQNRRYQDVEKHPGRGPFFQVIDHSCVQLPVYKRHFLKLF